jgi:hypothetical protein
VDLLLEDLENMVLSATSSKSQTVWKTISTIHALMRLNQSIFALAALFLWLLTERQSEA